MTEDSSLLSSSLIEVSDYLFKKAKTEKESNGSISDETLEALSFIHGPYFLSAMDLVDRDAVCHVTCPSGKGLYQVKSSAGRNVYNCHLIPNALCSCPSFSYGAVAREDAMFCKHLLAVNAAEALGTTRQEMRTDEAFQELFGEDID